MKSRIPATTIAMVCLVATGCDDDPVSQPSPSDFGGAWTLVSTVVAKAACAGSQPDDFLIEEVRIDQEGGEAMLTFGDYSLAATIQGERLTAEGVLPTSESLRLQLSRVGEVLEGDAELASDSCQEQRTVVAQRRLPDADFSGYWAFELTVTGEDRCPHIVDYHDCFGIIQNGSHLLVVDDEAGNLVGQVTGTVAQIERNTAREVTTLLFHIDTQANRLTGTAIRTFFEQDCRTVLDFVGTLREEPCAGATP